jgi:glyoxylase-like metal-dependent hydrolase (beta-lactamase superfamily II)
MRSWNLTNGYKIYKVLTNRCNTYLIATPKGNLLIDTGLKRYRKKLIKSINSLDLTNTKIDFLILTHTHFDHCQNARFLKKTFNCQIIIGEPEKEFAQKGYTPAPRGTNWLTNMISKLGNSVGKNVLCYETFEADFTEKTINFKGLGFDIDVLNTPGHSSGSISIIVNKETALVGDTMFGVFKNSIFPPFADNKNELFGSWKKLLDSGCNLFLPGHGGEINRELVKKELKKRTKN